jgi:hypothetical protein
MVGAGLVGGLGLGVLIGGIGGRVAMRLIFLADPESRGVTVAGDFNAGRVTMAGTFLVLMTGAALGGAGGLLYVVARRWLPRSRVWRGVVYGLFLTMISTGLLFRGETSDNRMFEPPLLGITFFALLIFLYGLSLPLVVDRFDTYVPAVFRQPTVSTVGSVFFAGLTIFGLILTASEVM